MITLTNALLSLRPNKEFSWSNDDLSTLVWHSPGTTTPTLDELNAEVARLEALQSQKKINKEIAQASALVKLAALGLTGEEIAAITNN
jgi:hypothetical protein